MSEITRSATLGVLALAWVCLPLGAAPTEITAVLVLLFALIRGKREYQPFLLPVIAVGIAWLLPSFSSGIDGIIAALGETWPLILLVALPPLLVRYETRPDELKKIETIGLGAAGFASIWALGDLLLAQSPPWVQPARGPFSHHLTLGYALIPPTAVALVRRRWVLGTVMISGILSSGSSGPVLALAVVIAALRFRPSLCLFGGVGISLGIMLVLSGNPELQTRLTHWTAGAQVLLDAPGGQGVIEATHRFQAQERSLSSVMRPETHAHDSILQWGMLGGMGAWLAWLWLLTQLWSRTQRAGRATIAALGVSALTQDVFGDLEVIRALSAWVVLDIHLRSHPSVSEPVQRGYDSDTVVSVPRSP